METANLIILRKTPYGETSLIISGLSDNFGKLDLLIKGARKTGKKKFPAVDLFREIQVTFSEKGSSELRNATGAEVIRANDSLVNDISAFEFASHAGSFILKNTAADLPCPLTYESLRHILQNLALLGNKQPAPWNVEECSVILKTTFLYENGMLPEELNSNQEKNQQTLQFLHSVIECGNEGTKLNSMPTAALHKISKWLNSLIKYQQLKY
ncbi:DNA repair protein RecO [Lentisphaerota bacterium ZTH]|nr:DNA repair protein RecO [Lentisphaerota bacterium]WET07199.1 DNA repair protein RecO [Lentisphaerota bacterium ZTH]